VVGLPALDEVLLRLFWLVVVDFAEDEVCGVGEQHGFEGDDGGDQFGLGLRDESGRGDWGIIDGEGRYLLDNF
jgi:hypothetical protein